MFTLSIELVIDVAVPHIVLYYTHLYCYISESKHTLKCSWDNY